MIEWRRKNILIDITKEMKTDKTLFYDEGPQTSPTFQFEKPKKKKKKKTESKGSEYKR